MCVMPSLKHLLNKTQEWQRIIPMRARDERQEWTTALNVQHGVQSSDLQRKDRRPKVHPVQPKDYNNTKSSKGDRRKQEGMEKEEPGH